MIIRNFALILSCILLISCDNTMEEQELVEKGQPVILDDTQLLKKFINLPAGAESARWLITEDSQTQNSSLLAVIKFSDDGYADIVQRSTKHSVQGKNEISSEMAALLFYQELQQYYASNSQEQSVVLNDTSTYDANVFINPDKSPLVNGSVIALQSNYIFLDLYSM